MFPWIKYQWSLWKATTGKRRVQKIYAALYRKAEKEKRSAEDKRNIMEESFHEIRDAEEEITAAITGYLYTLAHRYRVPTPDYADNKLWEQSSHTWRRNLTENALADFRAAIRNEQKERLQLWELRLKVAAPLLTGLTGAVGALIGLVAIFRK